VEEEERSERQHGAPRGLPERRAATSDRHMGTRRRPFLGREGHVAPSRRAFWLAGQRGRPRPGRERPATGLSWRRGMIAVIFLGQRPTSILQHTARWFRPGLLGAPDRESQKQRASGLDLSGGAGEGAAQRCPGLVTLSVGRGTAWLLSEVRGVLQGCPESRAERRPRRRGALPVVTSHRRAGCSNCMYGLSVG
jgi:hypothetical protein